MKQGMNPGRGREAFSGRSGRGARGSRSFRGGPRRSRASSRGMALPLLGVLVAVLAAVGLAVKLWPEKKPRGMSEAEVARKESRTRALSFAAAQKAREARRSRDALREREAIQEVREPPWREDPRREEPRQEEPEERVGIALAAAASPRGFDPSEDADAIESEAERRSLATATAVARALSQGAAPTVAPAPTRRSAAATGVRREPVAEASSGQPNRFVALEVSGVVGGEALSPDDPQVWGRIGLFLGQESAAPFHLVRGGGVLPPVLRTGADGQLAGNPVPAAGGAVVRGDPGMPTYRMVIELRATPAAPVTFYGQKVASAYQCRIACRIEVRGEKGYQLLDQVAVAERLVRQTGPGDSDAELLRQATGAALEKLAARLKQLAVFRAPPPGSQPPPASPGTRSSRPAGPGG
jgi:hypothetical protein